jgi:hypothetical protein
VRAFYLRRGSLAFRRERKAQREVKMACVSSGQGMRVRLHIAGDAETFAWIDINSVNTYQRVVASNKLELNFLVHIRLKQNFHNIHLVKIYHVNFSLIRRVNWFTCIEVNKTRFFDMKIVSFCCELIFFNCAMLLFARLDFFNHYLITFFSIITCVFMSFDLMAI